jgi:hypothetical protein
MPLGLLVPSAPYGSRATTAPAVARTGRPTLPSADPEALRRRDIPNHGGDSARIAAVCPQPNSVYLPRRGPVRAAVPARPLAAHVYGFRAVILSVVATLHCLVRSYILPLQANGLSNLFFPYSVTGSDVPMRRKTWGAGEIPRFAWLLSRVAKAAIVASSLLVGVAAMRYRENYRSFL